MGNHNTALFGELDTRLARRWNLDPKPVPSVSSYAMFDGNPIRNSDVLLDSSVHVNEKGDVLANIKDLDQSVYQHPNSMSPLGLIAAYAYGRAATGTTSAGGKKIGKLGGTIDVSGILKNVLAEEYDQIYSHYGQKMTVLGWVNNVRGGGKWDYKANKNTIFGVAWSYDLAQIEYSHVDRHTNFYYPGLGIGGIFNAADVGNYNAGYTGTLVGVWKWAQKVGAGVVEQGKMGNWENFNPNMWPDVFADAPYGDRERDYQFNIRGMRDAQPLRDNMPKTTLEH